MFKYKNKDKKLILNLPFGFRDIFPLECAERNTIDQLLREEFISWGYGEIKTPVVEYTENISEGAGPGWKNKLISFFDSDGNIISLRADMTVPIARLAGMRLKENQLPARFFYFANSFRQSGSQKGQKRVINQAGLEFIGAQGLSSDIEILNILVNILKKAGLADFKIALGHILFWQGIAQWFRLDQQGYGYLKKNLIEKNYLALNEFLSAKDSAKAANLFNLVKPSGNARDVLDLADGIPGEKVSGSIKYMKELFLMLENLGLSGNLILDMSIMREFEYYSGVVFEVYISSIPEAAGSGGRYDGLLKKFGLNVPATGFALDVDILHKAIQGSINNKAAGREKIILCSDSQNTRQALAYSQLLREKNFIVELLFDFKSQDEAKFFAMEKKADLIYIPDFRLGVATVIVLPGGKTKKIKL